MKPHHSPLAVLVPAVLVALACPAVAPADTVYYEQPGSSGISSIAGTIVQETDAVLEVETDDGRTVSIPKDSVFKVIRDTPSETGYSHQGSEFRIIGGTPAEARSTDLHADASPSGRVYHFGVKGGMNVANMNVDPQVLEEDDSLKSYALGAWLGVPLNRRLAVQAEALYSVKGDSESAGGYTASTRMTYIDVPVVARIGFMHDSPARPSLFLGPSLAFNIAASSKLEGGGDGTDLEVDVKDDVRAFDLGLLIGGGVDFSVGKRTLGVELRYSKGLSNVAGDGANGSAKNDVIAVLGSIGLQ